MIRYGIVRVQKAYREGTTRVVWDYVTNKRVEVGQRLDENLQGFCERLNEEEKS